MKDLEGPDLANSGDIVKFTCRYDLGKDAIYSIKWYKEDNELYRYIPTDSPETRYFRGTPGVIIMVRGLLLCIINLKIANKGSNVKFA